MRILSVSDVSSAYFYDYYTSGRLDEFDLILACGDLHKEYLEFLITMAHCPVVYVRGNHDDAYANDPPGGCLCAADRIVTVNGVRILGLGGSFRYRDGLNLYTEEQMARRVLRLKLALWRSGGFDILLTHAPARGVNDFDNRTHRGFQCFTALLDQYRPKYFVHGHIHRSYGANIPQISQHGDTTVINASGYCIFDY